MFRRSPILRRAGAAVLLAIALGAHAAAPGGLPYPNTRGFGVDFDAGEDWHRECMRVAHLPAPRARAATAKTGCDATALYYLKRDQALTTLAEWRAVGACAMANGDDAVLMMLHANGHGLARDTDRAIHHACKLDAAKAEMEARVAHLASGAVEQQPFDLCDHITSGRMGSFCTGIGESRDNRVRQVRLDRFATTLPAAARAPFARLRQAAAAFAQKSADEKDMTGTGAAGFATQRVGRRHEEFMETVFNAASGKLAPTSARRFASLDRQLNAEYRALLARPSEDADHPQRIGHSTVTRNDVRSTERLWLAYRDAWAGYLSAARAPVDLVSVQAQLTRQRIAQLKRI